MGTYTQTIVCTYDPSTKSLSCSSETVTVPLNDTGEITVTLQTAAGTIAFASPAIVWQKTPDGVSVVPNSNSGNTSLTINDPNSYDYSYPFTVYAYYYAYPGANKQPAQGDPTIVNEGTGQAGPQS